MGCLCKNAHSPNTAGRAGRLQFFGDHARLADHNTFAEYLAPLRKAEWVVYAKKPFTGPEQVSRYLSRYTHRVAISNRRLVSSDDRGVVFKWKDYRIEGPGRYKTMTLDTHEFHRIRHYALLASGNRAANIAQGLPDPSLEFHRPCDPNLEAEVTQGTARVTLDGNVLRQQLAKGSAAKAASSGAN